MADGPTSENTKTVREALDRFKRCVDWESQARVRYRADIKFANGDSDNGFQWPDQMRQGREVAQRPTLTINKVRQHNLQIINDAKQNKPGVKVKPVGNEATYEAAEVFEGIVRHIEYISNAQTAYDTATTSQVEGGIGYWRVVTDYAGPDTFDQEVFIRRVRNPLMVYLDPDIKEADGSDARFAFLYEDMPRDMFDAAYPKFKDAVGQAALGNGEWFTKDHVRICEYYRTVRNEDKLVVVTGQDGAQVTVRASEIPPGLRGAAIDSPSSRIRAIVDTEVEWFLIVGDQIAEKKKWPGRYIPVVRVIGEETVIDGVLDRKGHTRAQKDPQRMYNFWTSGAVEHVALQGKTPYIGPMRAFNGYETYWDRANTDNFAWLPYNDTDDAGNTLQGLSPPQRAVPPQMAPAYIAGMQIASDELRSVTGQYQSEMGMPSNEKSGVAIQQRQRQGDNATYHFIDNLAVAIRFTGKILIDLIPKVYDTPRVIKIMGESGVEREVMIRPGAGQAYVEEKQAQQDAAIRAVFDPTVGRYEVEADVGPAYATRRQEAFQAFVQLASQNKEIMQIAGDLVFRAADFPMADDLAERYRKIIPPHVLGDGPSPEMQQMQQQLQQMRGMLQTTMAALAEAKQKQSDDQARVALEAEGKHIDAYKAETDRLKVLAPALDANAVAEIAAKLVIEALTTGITPGPETMQ